MIFTCNNSPKSEVTLLQDANDVDIFVGEVRIAWLCGDTGTLYIALPSDSGLCRLAALGMKIISPAGQARRIRVHDGNKELLK